MTTVVEARGVRCPVPIIRLARACAELAPGSVVELLTDDPAAEHDVPAWCRLRGHAVLTLEPVPPEPTDGAPALGDSPGPLPGPEPHVPNPRPGQAMRHRIRLGPAAAP